MVVTWSTYETNNESIKRLIVRKQSWVGMGIPMRPWWRRFPVDWNKLASRDHILHKFLLYFDVRAATELHYYRIAGAPVRPPPKSNSGVVAQVSADIYSHKVLRNEATTRINQPRKWDVPCIKCNFNNATAIYYGGGELLPFTEILISNREIDISCCGVH